MRRPQSGPVKLHTAVAIVVVVSFYDTTMTTVLDLCSDATLLDQYPYAYCQPHFIVHYPPFPLSQMLAVALWDQVVRRSAKHPLLIMVNVVHFLLPVVLTLASYLSSVVVVSVAASLKALY